MGDIKDLLTELSSLKKSLATIEAAKVVSVDKEENTCIVTLLDAELELEVKLKTVTGSAADLGYIMYPLVGSFISICMVDGDPDNLRVLDCTKIESVAISIGSKMQLHLDLDGNVSLNFLQLVLGGGNNGGLIKIEPLLKKVNKLEERLNDAIEAIQTHKHGAAGTPPAPPITLAKLDVTKRAEIENKEVKH